MSDQSVKDKTVKGIGWSALENFLSQGVTFVVGIVLARLLSPDEFGTIGVAMIFVALFNKIVDCGFSNALIRKQNVSQEDYSTTFIFNLLLSLSLYVICYIVAPHIAIFFHNDLLISVVRWISLTLIINAFAIVQRTRLVKSIDFKTQAKVSLIASISSGVIGIVMAFYGCGVWSLVGQQLSRQFLNTTLLWIVNKWLPTFAFSIKSFKELFSYGGKLMLSGIIDTLFNEITTIVVGRIYTPATLGQYSRAKQFSGIFSSNLSSVMERVTYPVLSEFQNDEMKLLGYYKKIIKVLMMVTSLGTIFIACCSRSIILILIGPKWTEAIVYLQLLAFVELTIPLKNVNLNLMQVYGRSDYILKLSIIKRFIELGAICLGLIDIKVMLVGFAIAGIIGFLLNAGITSRISGYRVSAQLKDILPSLIVSLLVGVCMYGVGMIVNNIYLAFLFQILVGISLFIMISERLQLDEYQFAKRTVFEKLKIRKYVRN